MNVISGKVTSDDRLRFNCNHNKMFYGKVEILNKEGDFKAKIKPPFYFGNINKKVNKTDATDKHELKCGCEVEYNEDDGIVVTKECNHETSCNHDNCVNIEDRNKYNTIIKFKVSDGEPREPNESDNESANYSVNLDDFDIIKSLGNKYYATTYKSVTEALKNNANTNLNVISELYILDSAKLTSIDAYTFNRQNITDKNNVYHNIETLHLPESLTEISESAFDSIQDLTSLVIPDNVSTLGASAFNACGNLKHLSLSTALKSIPNNCFSACGNLESLIIPNGVISIGENAFYNCENLSSLQLPETLENIGTDAFRGCKKLKSLIIPSNIKTIGQDAFRECNELTQLIFSSVENENDKDVGEQEMTISQGAFYGCKKLKKIILPKNFKTIANDTFFECVCLEELHLLNNNYYGTGSNGANAFADANNLKKIVISNRMLSKSTGCGFNNILQSNNIENLIIQIDGLDIKNSSLVDNEDKTYSKNISTLDGFKSSVLYKEFVGIFKNELNENKVKNMPYQEKDDYKCKFIDMNGVDIIDTFGGIDVNNYSRYTLNGENIILNKYVNIMDTVFNDVKGIILSNNDNTWKMLSNDKQSFTIKKDGKIPEKLEHLQLSDNVTALEKEAFSGSKLIEVNILNIPILPASLCEGCETLTTFSYTPSECKVVNENILKNCINLNSVTITDFSKFMSKEGTLYGCTNLKDIYINYQESPVGYAGWSITIKTENNETYLQYSLPTSALSSTGERLNVHFMNLESRTDGMYLNGVLKDKDQIIANIASNTVYQCFNHTFNTENGTTKLKINIYDNKGNNFMILPIPEETQGN